MNPRIEQYLTWLRIEIRMSCDPETGEITPDDHERIRERSVKAREVCGVTQ